MTIFGQFAFFRASSSVVWSMYAHMRTFAHLPYAPRLAPSQHQVVHLARLHRPPLEQAGQLRAQVRLGLLQGVEQQRHRVIGPAFQPLDGCKVNCIDRKQAPVTTHIREELEVLLHKGKVGLEREPRVQELILYYQTCK